MMVPHPTKLLTLCSLILTATAFPAPFSNLDATVAAHCQLSCQLTYSKCFARSGNSNFCRNLVNDSYDDKCTGCDYALAFVADIQPTSNSHELSARDVANEAAMNAASTKCIIICGHGWCRPLCAITGPPPSGSTDNTVDASTSSSMTDLVASTNAQPGQIGIPLSPNTATIVLGQKDQDGKTEKCAWICSSETQACQETCWATGDIQGARVTDGGYLAVDQAIEGTVGCDVMDKDEIGPLIVCVVPTVEGGGSIGAGDIDWNQMRCVLFWQDRKPHIVCRHV